MIFSELIDEMALHKDEKQAEKMANYMQNIFAFWGIAKPDLKKLIAPHLSKTRKDAIDWDSVFALWDMDFREAQYVAIEYLKIHKKQIEVSDLENIKKLITSKSWWETVDDLDDFIGQIVKKDKSLADTILSWSQSDNIWLRRVSIDYQLKYKDETDAFYLSKAICNNFGSTEFFVNKAIGWSLREYSKYNPDWVKQFLKENESKMAKLSIREAIKYLEK